MSYQQQSEPQVPILLLKEGTRETKKKDAQSNNIATAKTIADILKSSLGPRGMDKMLVDSLGDVTITNDGAKVSNIRPKEMWKAYRAIMSKLWVPKQKSEILCRNSWNIRCHCKE